MKFVRLGMTGIRVSELCLGTMTFGKQTDQGSSHSILSTAFEAGVNFIDTADAYPQGGDLSTVGTTEMIVGEWLKGKRDQIIVATKCANPVGPNSWDRGNSRKHILDAVEGSLRRLGVEYIDLYQLHQPDPETPLEETLSALDWLVQSGKARYVGVSNWQAWQVALGLGKSEARTLSKISTVQPRYNLLFRENERELFPLCLAEQLGVMAYNPLAGGILTGKHSSAGLEGEPELGTRFALSGAGPRYRERYWHESAFDVVDQLKSLADEAGMPLTTLAIAWVLANPAVTVGIIGASQPRQLDETLRASDALLDADLLTEIDSLTLQFRKGDALR